MTRNGGFSRSAGAAGTGSFAAAATSAPKARRRPLGACTTAPASARQAAAATFQRAAAAATSISRAWAPARRIGFHSERMARLPPVLMSPYTLAGTACSMRTLPHSAPSSSATSMASAVLEPWPISVRAMSTVTVPSGATRR